MKDFIKFLSGRKLIIFGTGEKAGKFASEMENDAIAFFLDNNYEKQKKRFMSKNVYSPSILYEEDRGKIFIVVASMYYSDIKNQLINDFGLIEGIHFEFCDYVKYVGDNFFCSFCEKSYSYFLPMGNKSDIFENNHIIGGGYRENAVCPRCYSLDRERHLYLYLKEETDIFYSNRKVLHIAPEHNLKSKLSINKDMEYICGDLYPQLEKGIIKLDITDLPFKDNYFDTIICNHVLEHVLDDRKAVGEIFRVLKKGGWAILQVPISDLLEKTYEDISVETPEERLVKFGQSDHVRIYGKDYVEKLENEGFSVKIYSYQKKHGVKLTEKYGLLKDERMFICYK